MRVFFGIMLALLFVSEPAQAKPLIADMSGYHIAIDSGFTGTHLLLFGARNETGDVIVVIRGPTDTYMVRKKEQVGGFLWLNRSKQRLEDVPSFYIVASNKPLKDIKNAEIFAPLGIGLRQVVGEGKEDFINAFLLHQQMRSLYIPLQTVSFMDESLFKLVLPFPDNIPRGSYSADVYLINDGNLTSMQSIPLQVERTGFDALVYESAHNHGVLYGLFAVVMALVIGWGASRLIHKW
jgi:uncharacterized protein (TIGR02186 family)